MSHFNHFPSFIFAFALFFLSPCSFSSFGFAVVFAYIFNQQPKGTQKKNEFAAYGYYGRIRCHLYIIVAFAFRCSLSFLSSHCVHYFSNYILFLLCEYMVCVKPCGGCFFAFCWKICWGNCDIITFPVEDWGPSAALAGCCILW